MSDISFHIDTLHKDTIVVVTTYIQGILNQHFSRTEVNYISVLFYSMKVGSRDHINTSSEAINEEDTSGPSDVRMFYMKRLYLENYKCNFINRNSD